MIYLIGGPPRVGKSTVAAAMSDRIGCSWVPTDYLASAINPYHHGPGGEVRPTRLGGDIDSDERYARFTTAEILANYRSRAAFNRLGILEGFVEYAAADSRDFVVEGIHLEPEPMAGVRGRWPDRIRPLVLIRTDRASVAASLARIDEPADWVARTVSRSETFERIADLVVAYSQALIAEAEPSGCPVLDTSRWSLEESVDRAVGALLGDDERDDLPWDQASSR